MASQLEQLEEAREAYHELMTGKAPRVVVDMSGERVEFVSANSQKLALYIQQLETQVGTSLTPVTRGPAGFLF